MIRKWTQFASRRIQLAVAEPKPKQRGDPPAAFAMTLRKVENWPIHRELLNRVEADGHKLEFSAQVSFFHRPSRSFFGSTWEGRSVKAEKMEPGENSIVKMSVTLNDLVFWYTYIDDKNTLAVIELVATEFDGAQQIKLAQYACGWTFLKPFGQIGCIAGNSTETQGAYVDVRNDRADLHSDESYSSTHIFKRTPRVLAFLSDAEFAQLDETAFEDTRIQYRVLQHQRLLQARHLIYENELVGPSDIVAGMRPTAVPGPVGTGNSRIAALGLEVDRRDRDEKVRG